MLLVACWTSNAAAAPALGGNTGEPFDLKCDDGDALVGLNLSAGKARNLVGPICNSVGKTETDGAISRQAMVS